MFFFRLQLHTQIFIGMLLGVAYGLFFGEMAGSLQPVGEAFIMLLKMTILPFMSFSLIHAIGNLSWKEAKTLFKNAALLMPCLWALTLIIIYSTTLLFPVHKAPFYYGNLTSVVGPRDSLLSLFIPINPIHAFANDIIPAVVVFSLLFGIALIQLRAKNDLLHDLKITISALTTITRWAAQLSPVGVFALIASTTGTMSFREFDKVRLYVTAFLLGTCFLTFVLFPLIISVFTPLRARSFLRELQPALLLAFTTGNVLISLPYIIQALEKLNADYQPKDQDANLAIKSMVPIAYNFPTVGNLFALLFILFLSSFYAQPFTFSQHVKMVFLGIPVLFGAATSVINGTSFLIDKLHLPADGIGLFLNTLPLTRNFQTLSSTMSIAALAALLSFASVHHLKVKGVLLLRYAFGAICLLVVLIVGARFLGPGKTESQEVFSSLQIVDSVSSITYTTQTAPKRKRVRSRYMETFDRVQDSGVLRVGYNPDNMPFAYFNNQKQLAGYDIAFAHDLAKALHCRLEFYPFEYQNLTEDLANNRFDIAMSAVSVTTDRLRESLFSEPYVSMERALIVEDYRRKEFADLEKLKERDDLKICALEGTSFVPIIRAAFPKAEIVTLSTVEDFLVPGTGDAFFWARKEGTTWALIHPKYTVVIPSPSMGKEYYAYAVQEESPRFLQFVNYWLDLREKDSFSEKQHSYWILGKVPSVEPRWSVIRDVLHWID